MGADFVSTGHGPNVNAARGLRLECGLEQRAVGLAVRVRGYTEKPNLQSVTLSSLPENHEETLIANSLFRLLTRPKPSCSFLLPFSLPLLVIQHLRVGSLLPEKTH